MVILKNFVCRRCVYCIHFLIHGVNATDDVFRSYFRFCDPSIVQLNSTRKSALQKKSDNPKDPAGHSPVEFSQNLLIFMISWN